MGKTILFVDDDDIFLKVLRRVSRSIDEISETLFARDGADALRQIEEAATSGATVPDLAFIDINMPVLDGFGFLEGLTELRRHHPRLQNLRPVVMLTSSEQPSDRARAEELGADKFIVKGMSLADIQASIEEML